MHKTCIGLELFINIIIYHFFFKCEREFLNQKLICTILSFFSCISSIFMPGMTILRLDWLACPAWLLSLFSLHHAGHEHSVWDPDSLSFRKWGVLYNRETKLMSMKQFFHVSVALKFISIDELVRYVFMPMQHRTLDNHKLEQLYSLELCEGMTK